MAVIINTADDGIVEEENCWEHAKQSQFLIAYLMLSGTAFILHLVKTMDPTLSDEIDSHNIFFANNEFEDWFANAAISPARASSAGDANRATARSYLPAVREIQQYQQSLLHQQNDPQTDSEQRDRL